MSRSRCKLAAPAILSSKKREMMSSDHQVYFTVLTMRRVLTAASLIQFFLAHLNVLNCRATILLVAVLLTLVTSSTCAVVLIIAWQSIIGPTMRC